MEKLFFSDASTSFTYGRYFLWFRMAFELIENILSYFQISFRCSACSLSQSQTKHYAVKMTFILKHHFFLSTQCFPFQTRRLFKRHIFWLISGLRRNSSWFHFLHDWLWVDFDWALLTSSLKSLIVNPSNESINAHCTVPNA